MNCAENLAVQAYFDGEIDAASAARVAQHLEGCAGCRQWLAELRDVSARVRQESKSVRTPDALRSRIAGALDAADARHAPPSASRAAWRTRSFWWGAFAGMGGFATASLLAFLMWLPGGGDTWVDTLAAAHQQSLLPGRLIAVESSDHHTVKPWFAGRADVSPVVADFAPRGFTLLGGRADTLGHERAAVLVYRHQRHVINVFSWRAAAGPLPRDTRRDGFHMIFWQAGDLRYAAVSDAGWNELRELERLLLELDARDRPG